MPTSRGAGTKKKGFPCNACGIQVFPAFICYAGVKCSFGWGTARPSVGNYLNEARKTIYRGM